MNDIDCALVWFRRDLRAIDHAALSQAMSRARRVYCVFVFDTDILDALPSRTDRRVEFLWRSLVEIDRSLRESGSGVIVRRGRAAVEIPKLALELHADAVFVNRDYEPAACARDHEVATALGLAGIKFHSFKDQVIFECDELLTAGGHPYSVFTPYKNAWRRKLDAACLEPHPVHSGKGALAKPPKERFPTLGDLGFECTDLTALRVLVGTSGAERLLADFLTRIDAYQARRDYPALKGPSYLSVHLRFGTISIRRLVGEAQARSGEGPLAWLSELIWREFYFQILHHHPQVVRRAFRQGLEEIEFDNDPDKFQAWCEGRTGYPLVDAGMRQLNQTGYMHNRLRMLTASFLVKDLHVDWRWGERYFAEKLIDYDLAANNGGWQWAASTGCDAQPYFRIFNPVRQSEKFDPNGDFVRRYVPELSKVSGRNIHAPWTMGEHEQEIAGCRIGRDYPAPVTDHERARRVTLERYRRAREQ